MTERTLSPQARTFLSNLQDGSWQPPIGLKNLGIRPDLWLKEFDYGYTRYEWPQISEHAIYNEERHGLPCGARPCAQRRPPTTSNQLPC